MWVRRFSIEASTGGAWRNPAIAPLRCRNEIEPGPRRRCAAGTPAPNAAALQAPAHELPHVKAKGALMRRRSFAWWEDAVIALGLWLAAVLALSARRRG